MNEPLCTCSPQKVDPTNRRPHTGHSVSFLQDDNISVNDLTSKRDSEFITSKLLPRGPRSDSRNRHIKVILIDPGGGEALQGLWRGGTVGNACTRQSGNGDSHNPVTHQAIWRTCPVAELRSRWHRARPDLSRSGGGGGEQPPPCLISLLPR